VNLLEFRRDIWTTVWQTKTGRQTDKQRPHIPH